MIAFGAGSGGWRAMACEALGGANLFPTFANLFVTQPISCTHCPTCCHKHLQSTQSSRSYFLDAQASLAPIPLSRLARFSLCRHLWSVTERPRGIPVVPGGQIFSESYDRQTELGLDGSLGGRDTLWVLVLPSLRWGEVESTFKAGVELRFGLRIGLDESFQYRILTKVRKRLS